jgi:hypothetical protein
MQPRQRGYRELVWELREHEGWRAYRWALLAIGLLIGVWVPPLVGGVAATYIVAGGSFPAITAGTVITLALGAVGSSWFGRRPWRTMLERRVAAYWQESNRLDYAMALISVEDFGRAMHSLRRAGLNAYGRSVLPIPGDVRIDTALSVFRPAICARSDQESVADATQRVLERHGIEATVNGSTGGRPIPSIVLTCDLPKA